MSHLKLKVPEKVSVIIIYQEDSEGVRECIESVRESLESLEPEIDYEILESTLPNKSRARNELAFNAEGEILVFIDSDALATPFWIYELLRPFEDDWRIGAVGGPGILKNNCSRMELLADKLLAFPLATWKSAARYKVQGTLRETDESELSSCNLAVRKSVFFAADGFPEDLIPCEENVLLERIQNLGYKLIYNPLAIVTHDRAPLLIPHLQKIFYYAEGRGRMIRRREGSLKLFPRPSVEYLILAVGLVLHYFAYIAGLIKGVIKG